jgi:S1-C subfamily serine protease
MDGRVFVAGAFNRGPANRAGLEQGDLVVAVAGQRISTLADFFRRVWSLGQAGDEVPLTIHRDGNTFDVRVKSGDRETFLKKPRMHS